MKQFLWICFFLILGLFVGSIIPKNDNFSQKIINNVKAPPSFSQYAINNIKANTGVFKQIRTLDENEKYTSYLYSFIFTPNPNLSATKQTSVVINIPKSENKDAVILLIRGYVDQKIYTSGMGTKNAGKYLAERGYLTVSPDFLGYGESDSESNNVFESRFQTYTTILSLIKSINYFQKNHLFIWAHSNGGQIALTALTATGQNIPTVLWAPVTKPFPYNVLYYSDESEDRGKFLRNELSKFEQTNNSDEFSFTNYIDRINSPIQIHQGSQDDAVPKEWNDSFAKKIEGLKYYVYPGADHNLQPSWNLAMQRTYLFFENHLK